MQKCTDAQNKILEVGKKEFLSKGFSNASLEKIVKSTGITQDVFYSYYPDKESLFDALVSKAADDLINQFKASQDAHFDLISLNQASESRELADRTMHKLVDYIYEHYDEFKLIICRSEGTKYAGFIQNLVTLDVNRTEEYLAELRRTGRSEAGMSFQLHHIISSAFFTAVFQTVMCDMTKEQAIHYVEELSAFFSSGWEGIKNH